MNRIVKIVACLSLVIATKAYSSETVEGAKKDYESFKVEMSAKLDTVEAKLVDLKAKAKQKGGEKHDAAIVELEKGKESLKEELAEAKQTGSTGWKKFKTKFASSVDKLNSKIQKKLND